MKGTSKFIMGATLVMVVTLAIVLGLILVLLAELYCSLLLRRRQLRKTNTTTIPISTSQTITTTSSAPPSHTPHSPLSPFSNVYSQGVLQAPRSFLFPCKNDLVEPKKQKKHEPNASPHAVGLVSLSFSSSPLASFLARAPRQAAEQDTLEGSGIVPCAEGGGEHLVYISNPIYENEEGKASGANTPFETPNTSPSRLETSGSSGEDDDHDAAPAPAHSPPSLTPHLTPMKKLSAEASSVSLRDATSLGTSGSDSHSINGPSSSSDTPCTSPSW